MGTTGVIAAGHPKTAEAGAEILSSGGSAVNAAIAAVAMSMVVEPILSSPGGGGFAMTRDANSGAIELIDFFPQTPLKENVEFEDATDAGVFQVYADFGTTTQAFNVGPATAATPGLAAGLGHLHNSRAQSATPAFGLSDLFAPAAEAARTGVTITDFQAHLWGVVEPILTATEGALRLYHPQGRAPYTGELFVNAGLADALELIAKGSAVDTDFGAAIVRNQTGRGHVTQSDFRSYEVITREPITVRLGSALVYLNPLPAASGVLIAHSLRQLDSTDPLALAAAFDHTDQERKRVGTDLAALVPSGNVRQQGTTHVSVIDRDGNACAITVSNGAGNGDVVEPYGFMMNNILGEQDVNPSMPNWPTNTRLSSMMSPTLIEFDDGSIAAIGSGGSNRIRTAISQTVARMCIDGAPLKVAIDAPRLHVEDQHVDFEDFGSGANAALSDAFGSSLAWPEPNLFYGGVHGATRHASGQMHGHGDARRGGHAIVI